VESMVKLLLGSGPEAVAKCKELLHRTPQLNFEEAKDYTARMIAGLRVSAEGQEGMASFLEKRKPRWVEEE
jgi:methylglutaconyl-CoA hydratase